jgi:hypothetical protein
MSFELNLHPPPLTPLFSERKSVPSFQCPKIRGLITHIFKSSPLQLYLRSNAYTFTHQSMIDERGCTAKQIHKLLSKCVRLKELYLEDRPICYQLAPAPKNYSTLCSNLKLLFSKYPQYQLANDLAVYDNALGTVPKGTDTDCIRAKLKELKRDLENPNLLFDSKRLLVRSLEFLISEYKPIQSVKMGLIISNSVSENGALLDEIKLFIEENIPIVMTVQLRGIHANVLDSLLKDHESYFCGDWLLILPKNCDPSTLGFKTTGICSSYTLISQLENLLLSDTTDQGYKRILSLTGHGFKDSSIAGLNLDEFLELMDLLDRRNVAFLSISSCFVGGTNSLLIGSEEHSYPIMLRSAVEKGSYGQRSLEIYSLLEKQLYFKPFPLARNLSIRPVSKRTFARLLKLDKTKQSLACLETLFLPTAVSEISKIPIISRWNSKILDLREAEKQVKTKLNSQVFRDYHKPRKYYLFADPVSELEIHGCSSGVGFAARGGDSRHIIRKVVLPNATLSAIAETTFKSGIQANKCFLIAHLECLNNETIETFRRVVFIQTPDLDQNQLLFQKEGQSDYTQINFSELGEVSRSKLSLSKALLIINQTLERVVPSSDEVAQFSLVQQGDEVFNQSMQKYF